MKRWIIIISLGLALGLGSAAGTIWGLGNGGAVHVGPWVTPLDAGGTGRDLYLRAAIAVRATLGLSRQEALYFAAAADSSGQTLRGTCTYKVSGADLPARWWSLTLYGHDHFLVHNPEHRWSFASVNVARDPSGGFSIQVGPVPRAGNWLDSGGTAQPILLIRLYQPSTAAAARPAAIALPAIEREGCQ